MRQATRTQWIKCTIAILLYLRLPHLGTQLVGLIVVPFIFDIYITKKIPWSFWKKSKNPTVRNVMSCRCHCLCIGCCLLCQYLHFPKLSDSFLVFGKVIAGRRLPVRQQDELWATCAEYAAFHAAGTTYTTGIQHQIVHRMAQWEYKRVPGFGKVKLNDIVVFNFPAGDTVATNSSRQTSIPLLTKKENACIPTR